MRKILDMAERDLKIPEKYLVPYGWDKAKIRLGYLAELQGRKPGRLILVTAMTPTKAGEGKTTTAIGLTDGLNRLGKSAIACLREPSLGPVWGIKGGAVGAMKARIVPSDDINLHFTGDFHALTSTINLMSAIIENHVYQGNELDIDPNRIVWPRALDINDRSLRSVTVAQDDRKATPHRSEFTITVASELMTIAVLAKDREEFMRMVNDITAAYDRSGNAVRFGAFGCGKAIYKMMADALNPNLVQTLEGSPVLVHMGPFANISLGVNSINATRLGMKLAEYCVTEAGFGSDLGAEKFLDIACRAGGFKPSAVVLVATARALKLHGGVKFADLDEENAGAVCVGLANLRRHYDLLRQYGIPVVLAVNRFPSDHASELSVIESWAGQNGLECAVSSAASDGGAGAEELARRVVKAADDHETEGSDAGFGLYSFEEPLRDKIYRICTKVYGADGVEYSGLAEKQLREYEKAGYGALPVCISKTPNSLSDDPKLLNAPRGFKIHIREVRLYSGAGLIVPLSGSLLMMPGLPKKPRALDEFN